MSAQTPSSSSRPAIPCPAELAPLLARVEQRLRPVEFWLFGSRARGDNRPDSDWDILAVLPDDAPDDWTDPIIAWELARRDTVHATLLSTKRSDLKAIWGLPNTIGYDLAREGVRLVVG